MMGIKKDYVGTEINGYLLLEELPIKLPTSFSHQRKHQARKFKVKHLETGEILTRTLGSIKNSPLKKITEYKNFRDYTGEELGCYKVIKLVEGSDMPAQIRKGGIKWLCLDKRTNKYAEVSSAVIQTMRNQRDKDAEICE